LHELFVSCEAVTPGEFKSEGEGLTIQYGFHPNPFGECLLAVTPRGICGLYFVKNGDRGEALALLRKKWHRARLQHAPESTKPYVNRIFFEEWREGSQSLHLFVKGTNFQIKVWEALLKIPMGQIVSYEDLAHYLNAPKASRAVGNAVANNPISFIIPCHRVVRKAGEIGNYLGGPARKKAILGWEAARVHASA
jgi:AraC family transcriptional regulator of adaptative response/methylated-DNA-[protein]-cysteine methyltransferase